MPSICFYFQVHQPYRIKRYSVFDIGNDHDYFEDANYQDRNNEFIIKKVAEKCYLPANKVMLDLIHRYPEFKISYSFSGTALEQMEKYAPEVIESFQRLVQTGNVEILDETYYHSLSFFYSNEEFVEQIRLHRDKIKKLFNYEPTVFRNTELAYNNELASLVEKLGYKGIVAEGWEYYLKGKSPNFVYRPYDTKNIKLLLKNYKLSDDIAFRFSNKGWEEYPLSAPKFGQWVNAVNGSGQTINLFMDYETFGEHQWEDTGIFNFLRSLPEEVLKHPDNNFKTPSEIIEAYSVMDELDINEIVTWADTERDLSAWTGNSMQKSALRKIYEIEESVIASDNEEVKDNWRKLQTSDHFYYMCTKWFSDGDVHKYFSPYDSPYEAFISYMNVLNDFKLLLCKK
ncbi:MAG: glycoside hydrolase family 57 protein [Candidatus Pacebacteria bacterium]|nr:glycoside hydrolase family 57 protein [Candidatus Paceibacterota bacterium]